MVNKDSINKFVSPAALPLQISWPFHTLLVPNRSSRYCWKHGRTHSNHTHTPTHPPLPPNTHLHPPPSLPTHTPGLSDGHVLPCLHLLVSVDDAGEWVPAHGIQWTISLATRERRGGEGGRGRRGGGVEEGREGEGGKERGTGEKKREMVCSSSHTLHSTYTTQKVVWVATPIMLQKVFLTRTFSWSSNTRL